MPCVMRSVTINVALLGRCVRALEDVAFQRGDADEVVVLAAVVFDNASIGLHPRHPIDALSIRDVRMIRPVAADIPQPQFSVVIEHRAVEADHELLPRLVWRDDHLATLRWIHVQSRPFIPLNQRGIEEQILLLRGGSGDEQQDGEEGALHGFSALSLCSRQQFQAPQKSIRFHHALVIKRLRAHQVAVCSPFVHDEFAAVACL